MNVYINNIRIELLSSAGSFNVGTTLNMIQNSPQRHRQVKQPDPNKNLRETFHEKVEEEIQSEVPPVPTVVLPI